MVLENCEPCMKYWIKNGRDMSGYQFLMRDQHIPDAHASPAPLMLTPTGEASSSQSGAIVKFDGARSTALVEHEKTTTLTGHPNAQVHSGKEKIHHPPSSSSPFHRPDDPLPHGETPQVNKATNNGVEQFAGYTDYPGFRPATPVSSGNINFHQPVSAPTANCHPTPYAPTSYGKFHQPVSAPTANFHPTPYAPTSYANFHQPAEFGNIHSCHPTPHPACCNTSFHPIPNTSFCNANPSISPGSANFHSLPTPCRNPHHAHTAPFGGENFIPIPNTFSFCPASGAPLHNADFHHAQVPFFAYPNFPYSQAPFNNPNCHHCQPPPLSNQKFHQTQNPASYYNSTTFPNPYFQAQTAPFPNSNFHATQSAQFPNPSFHPAQSAPSGTGNTHFNPAEPFTNANFRPAQAAPSGNLNPHSTPAARSDYVDFHSTTTAASESSASEPCANEDGETKYCSKCLDYLCSDRFRELVLEGIMNGEHIDQAHEDDENPDENKTEIEGEDEDKDEDADDQFSSDIEHKEEGENKEIDQNEIEEAHHGSNQIETSNDVKNQYEKEVMDTDEKPKDENSEQETTQKEDRSWCYKLYKATMDGNWETAKSILQTHKEAVRAPIRGNSETMLHVALAHYHETTFFVRKLLKSLLPVDLEVLNKDGYTALGMAAKVGNVEAAKMLVAKNPKSLYIPSRDGSFPIHNAARYGKKEMLHYLLDVTEEGHDPDPYDPKVRDSELLRLMIKAEYYEAALLLLQRVPRLPMSGMYANMALNLLAENPAAFSRGTNLGVFNTLFNKWMPDLQNKQPDLHITRDVESAVNEEILADTRSHRKCKRYIDLGRRKVHQVLWMILERIVPGSISIRAERLKAKQAKKLVKCLCEKAANNLEESSKEALMFKLSLMVAAENGIHQIVKEITSSFYHAIWYHDDNNSEVFRLAIKHRQHKVYHMLYDMGDIYKNVVWESKTGDTILHLAAYLAPSHRLRDVTGAALQMQRELQWFKEIESIVLPAHRLKKNNKGLTPQQVFTNSHRRLMAEGEKWMRDTATSCTVAAALIATVVFAAAITVPGGNNEEDGKPKFGSEKAFIIFGVADAISLFSSCTSILMFLSILTSRYREGDFLKALPKRLIIGLLNLFVSVGSMMAAFSSTLYLMYGHQSKWILYSVITPSCVLVAMFAAVQCRLIAEIFKSTYLSGIFKRRKGKRCSIMSGCWSRIFERC